MRNLKTIAVALVAFVSFTANAQTTKKIDVAKSGIEWTGKKVTGQHNGTIGLQSGALVFKGKVLKGGTFTVDMTSINTTDLSGKGKESLDGHLKADDFFGVDKFKTSTLVFTNISGKGNGLYTVTADLTIKGITKPITFDITVKGNTASTTLKVDRTKYDIKYGSGSFFSDLGDKTINDEFELKVNLAW
ncbi:YceI family protein [Flavobacterium terrigena]|uniref:Polyisoprenoid-binding protein YceI n=1 Tax=Flavobacterium terrigena TaxID=402734 RepID=A0A1H6WNH5_9FLAO|nr:YceI family protein [Flavobacterium terrigena]SEJ13915.1 Polyisoprenoid-binding protein YceI [Flavobacterium terrigena]